MRRISSASGFERKAVINDAQGLGGAVSIGSFERLQGWTALAQVEERCCARDFNPAPTTWYSDACLSR